MRVCMVVYSFFESDPRVRQYATALQKRGDTVDVIALRKADQPEFGVVEGINVFRIQARPINERRKLHYTNRILRFMLHSAVTLTRNHRKEPYQLIHVHSVPDFLVYSALMPKLSGAKVILDIHDLLPELYASKFHVGNDSAWFKLMSMAERRSCAFADHVIVANDLWRERLIRRSVAAEKCTTIRNYPALDL